MRITQRDRTVVLARLALVFLCVACRQSEKSLPPIPFATAENFTDQHGLAMDDTSLYWMVAIEGPDNTCERSTSILKIPKSGEAPTKVGSWDGGGFTLAIGAEAIYVASCLTKPAIGVTCDCAPAFLRVAKIPASQYSHSPSIARGTASTTPR